MAVRPIAHVGHPILRVPTQTVTSEELAGPEIQGVIDDLIGRTARFSYVSRAIECWNRIGRTAKDLGETDAIRTAHNGDIFEIGFLHSKYRANVDEGRWTQTKAPDIRADGDFDFNPSHIIGPAADRIADRVGTFR